MYRYNKKQDFLSSIAFSSSLIRKSKLSKQKSQKVTRSIPRSLCIKKVGNQIINIHNTTIKVQPSSFGLASKETIQSPKRLILKRRNERGKQLRDFEENFGLLNLRKNTRQNRERRAKTLQNQSQKKFQSRNYRTVDVQSRTIDDQLGLANKTIQQQLETMDIDIPDLIKPTIDWSLIKVPLTPHRALKKYSKFLTPYEMKQIYSFVDIYFLGHEAHKIKLEQNVGFDNKQGQYHIVVKDHIAYRYEIIEMIGAGAFGQCVKAFDHKRKQICAIKLIRNKPNFAKQGLVQLNILKFITQYDYNGKANIVKVIDSVSFRKHLCIVTQLLDISLYSFLKMNNFQGFNTELIRKFAVQILQGLFFLKSHQIAHCDLKPENILLKKIGKSGIKLIDFGTSCFLHQKYFTYIQSRFYRAPQIVLGIPYDAAIDMWSFGCIMAQLYTGTPLFPGQSQSQHVRLMYQVVGPPHPTFLKKCQKSSEYFNNEGKMHPHYLKKTKHCLKNITELQESFSDEKDFLQILRKCLCWDPTERIDPRQALMDKFIINGLPDKIRKQHIKQMNATSPYGLV